MGLLVSARGVLVGGGAALWWWLCDKKYWIKNSDTIGIVRKECKASGYTVYLLVNTIHVL